MRGGLNNVAFRTLPIVSGGNGQTAVALPLLSPALPCLLAFLPATGLSLVRWTAPLHGN